MTEKEKTLLTGCLNGDKAAWDAFVLQYSSLVYHTIRRTFGLYHSDPRTDLVEDLFQEVFLSLVQNDFKKLRQFRGDRGCSLASWLRVVAARLTIDFLRKQGAPSVEVTESLPSGQPDPPASLIDFEEEKLLSKALRGLPPRDRLFLDLSYRRELPPEEIAAILQVSVSAVYTQKSRVLAKLRETLRKAAAL
ncbi:MAG: sigma-70 family RNA polymerase sigma factor [Deltaproteobacteria bacterium]|nr:sigma-70 family RNA polymerase sigma factor [Deltaproteobacteria bacterium]